MKTLYSSLVLILMGATILSARMNEFQQRNLLEETAYFVTSDGEIHSYDYWSLRFGTHSYTVDREFPGEGTVEVEGTSNLALVSSGFIEGTGYGSRGEINVQSRFVIKENDSLTQIPLDSIDYIYMGGRRIGLKDGSEHDLYLRIEKDENLVQPNEALRARVFAVEDRRLSPAGTLEPVLAFSYSREGAKKAYKKALEAADQ
ncbi:MAG: hypothetical protein ACQEQ4_03385 [Fibrobacterota bacterium]